MGAGVCMLLTKDFVADSSFIDKKKKRWIKEGEGLGGKIDMELMVMREVKLGPYRFRSVPVYIFDDENNVFKSHYWKLKLDLDNPHVQGYISFKSHYWKLKLHNPALTTDI